MIMSHTHQGPPKPQAEAPSSLHMFKELPFRPPSPLPPNRARGPEAKPLLQRSPAATARKADGKGEERTKTDCGPRVSHTSTSLGV